MKKDKAIVGEFCWSELATNHIQAAKEFYGALFDWEFRDITHEELTYTLVLHDEREIAGIWKIPKEQETTIFPHWLTYVLVENLKEHIEKVKELGGTVQVPITKAGHYGQFAILTDPTGANFALWEPTDKERVINLD